MPLAPPFYHRPETMEQMVEQFTAKVLGLLGYETPYAWKPESLA